MQNKRIIGILPWKEGLVQKSYTYGKNRPGIRLHVALKTLDRWQLDEIVVIDISRSGKLNHALLDELSLCHTRTPLAVGGGIRNEDDVDLLLQAGADRFVLETLLFEDEARVMEIRDKVGRQALIGSMPVHSIDPKKGNVWPKSRGRTGINPEQHLNSWIEKRLVSEVLVNSVDTEGTQGTFPVKRLSQLGANFNSSVIWFGGISNTEARQLLSLKQTSAVSFGNLLFEKELTVPQIREHMRIAGKPVRDARLT